MAASPAEYQPKLAPRGANGSMDMSPAKVAAMQQQYALLQLGEGRLRREYISKIDIFAIHAVERRDSPIYLFLESQKSFEPPSDASMTSDDRTDDGNLEKDD